MEQNNSKKITLSLIFKALAGICIAGVIVFAAIKIAYSEKPAPAENSNVTSSAENFTDEENSTDSYENESESEPETDYGETEAESITEETETEPTAELTTEEEPEDLPQEAFDSFMDMITETEYVWNKCSGMNFEEAPASEIINDIILAWPYYELALYYYHGFNPIGETVADPLNMYNGRAVYVHTEGVHWVLENVFCRQPDYCDGESFYYYNDEMILKDRLGIGDPGYDVESIGITQYVPLGNGRYEITVNVQCNMIFGPDPSPYAYDYVFEASAFEDENGYFWRLHNFDRYDA